MLTTLFVFAMLANGSYLISLRELQRTLEIHAAGYWTEIGSPRSFAGRDSLATLKALFSSRIAIVCEEICSLGLLRRVRLLFAFGSVATGGLMIIGVLRQSALS